MLCSIQMITMTKLVRDGALLKSALELSADTDPHIVLHCADGALVTRSLFLRLHSRLISGLVDSVTTIAGERREYSIMLPDVPRLQSEPVSFLSGRTSVYDLILSKVLRLKYPTNG